ncbi:MAG: glycosyltransferase family 4 protein [Solirubrobacteraceae bacterium]
MPRLAIAQVTPFAWEAANDVNEYVARVSDELAQRGHRVLIIAPSERSSLVRDSRRAIRSHPEALLADPDENPRVLGVGEVLPFSPARRRAASLPIDVARTIEETLTALPLDVVNVHEPFAPSASSVALRHSHALNVGSFHAPTERVLSTQLAAPLSRLLFARLDARTVSYAATRNLLQRYFPGEYRVIAPGADPALERELAPEPELVMIATEERAALRVFLRALLSLPPELAWHATVWSRRPTAPPATLGRLLRDRVSFVDAGDCTQAQALARADIAVLASDGDRAMPGTLVRALGAGAVPIASRLPAYEEVLAEGERGFLFEPGEVQTLAAHLTSLLGDRELLERSAAAVAGLGSTLRWSRVADELEQIYLELVARRHADAGDRRVRARLSERRLIDVDLHMHTDHS